MKFIIDRPLNKSISILLLTQVLVAGCHTPPHGKLESLYRQRIPGSSKVIYDYDFSGAFVTSNERMGFAIQDSAMRFTEESLIPLPGDCFGATPTGTGLKMITIDNRRAAQKDTLLIPIAQQTEQINGIKVLIMNYKQTYGSATSTGLMEYEFDNMKETRDSLTFFNVVKKFGSRQFPSTVSFAKGNIKVIDKGPNQIGRIEINQVVIGRGDIYKPSAPLKLVENRPIVGQATYSFIPRHSISPGVLSDYGIFKEVKL